MLILLFLILSLIQGFGPVVSGYLTGLNEEVNELEYQLTHKEIARSDYDNAKHRLSLLRKYVEAIAKETRTDVVPELQILTPDELGILSTSMVMTPESLIVGDIIDDRWKLIGIEGNKSKYFIFNKIQVLAKRRILRDPKDAIETIIVIDKLIVPGSVIEQNAVKATASRPRTVGRTKKVDEVKKINEVDKVTKPPHIIYLYLPQYTDEAKRRKLSGSLVISAVFQKNRIISDVEVKKSIGYGLDERALESVTRMVFIPAKLNGESIDLRVNIVFSFNDGKVTYEIKN